jgi:hypothetical protein
VFFYRTTIIKNNKFKLQKIMHTNYIQSAQKQMTYYKSLGDKAMLQIDDQQLFWQPSPESNNIAMIVQHLSGNMLSRWTVAFDKNLLRP